jgi:hypothetical protein
MAETLSTGTIKEVGMINELMQAIDNFENEGKEEHDGSKIDLARVLKAIVKIYQTKGIEYLTRSSQIRRLIEKAKV